MARTVIGLFDNQGDAQAALRELEQAGYRDSATFVQNGTTSLASNLGSAGVPQEDAQIYANEVGRGGSLIILQALGASDADQAAMILDRHNVVDIGARGQRFVQTDVRTSRADTGYTNLYEGGEVAIPIIEEQITVGKREVESGGVRVQTRVEETPVNEQVTLRDERVTVERRPINQTVDPSVIDQVAQSGTIEVREHDEEAVVAKEARVVEEVVVNKQVEQRTETIQDSVRRTEVDVDQLSGQSRSVGSTGTVGSSSTTARTSSGATTGDEGMIERGLSKAENAAERAVGSDLNQDGDVGRRDPRNNF